METQVDKSAKYRFWLVLGCKSGAVYSVRKTHKKIKDLHAGQVRLLSFQGDISNRHEHAEKDVLQNSVSVKYR